MLDDTYNASPESTLAALNLLEELDGTKNCSFMGDMLELGQYEEEGHYLVGARAAEVVSDLITIGNRGRIIAASALKSNLGSCCVHSFDPAMNSIGYLKSTLTTGDVVLIKGSHSMHMDQIVFALGKEKVKETPSLSLSVHSPLSSAVIWGGPLLRLLRQLKIGKLIKSRRAGRTHQPRWALPQWVVLMIILPVIFVTFLSECCFIDRLECLWAIDHPSFSGHDCFWTPWCNR